MLWAVAAVSMASAVWLGAQATSEDEFGVVAGVTLDSVTGVRVTRAAVWLEPVSGGDPMSATTDEYGRFNFDRVKPGRYTLRAVKDAYERLSYGSTNVFAPGKILTVSKSQRLANLEYAMVPRGSISGRVINQLGEPVRGVELAIGMASIYGGPVTMDVTGIQTDDLGRFRIHSLPSGTFYIQAIPVIQRASRLGPGAIVLPTYFHSMQDLAAADGVSLQPGRDVSGLEIVLREGDAFEVSGRLDSALQDTAHAEKKLLLLPLDHNVFRTPSYSATISRRVGAAASLTESAFHLSGVEPGTYELTTMSTTSGGESQIGRVEIEVGREDRHGVVMSLDRAVSLPWKVKVEGEEWTGNSCWFMINPFDADPMRSAFQVLTGPDGSLTMSGVLPGRYVVTSGCKKELYVKTARYYNLGATQDLLDAGLDLRNAGSGGSVEVVLSRSSAVVTGSIRDDDQPSPSRFVTLIPDPPLPGQTLRFRSTMTDEAGRFRISGVAPGDYHLYAWIEQIPSLVLVNHGFLARFQAQAKKITISSGLSDIGEWITVRP